MKIGITGTRKAVTDSQIDTLSKIFQKLKTMHDYVEFHQGDCIGADEVVTKMLMLEGWINKVVTHPPTNSSLRSYITEKMVAKNGKVTVEILKEKDYLDRNKDIVSDTDLLVVVPKEDHEILRSGTWATYRSAKKNNKNIIIVYPDGSLAKWPDTSMIKSLQRRLKNDDTEGSNKDS